MSDIKLEDFKITGVLLTFKTKNTNGIKLNDKRPKRTIYLTIQQQRQIF